MVESSSVEKLMGLKRRVDVVVAAELVGTAYAERLQKVAKTVKMDGFRPGKIPHKVVEQRFGKNILAEVADELMRQHFVAAVEKHDLRIAGTPRITPKNVKAGEALEYSIECEVYPDVTLADMSQVTVQRDRVELTEKDIDHMLDVLRKQQAKWVDVDRAAASGDKVTIDFVGKINGTPFERGAAEGFSLELGAGQMIPGFEDAILGKKPGDTFEIHCSFPKDYSQKELSGQPAVFETKLTNVLEAQLPEVDEAFITRLGVTGGLAELREDIRKNMQRQVEQLMFGRFKQKVMDQLLALNTIEVPEALVETEIEHMQQAALQRLGEKAKGQDAATLFPREHFAAHAKERVTLGLLLGEVIKQNQLMVDDQIVKQKIADMAAAYGGQAEQVISWYYKNERMLAEVQAMVLEEQAVDKLALQMQIEDHVISYEQATKQSEADDVA